eukprot:1730601-Amphidinium_carterae.1
MRKARCGDPFKTRVSTVEFIGLCVCVRAPRLVRLYLAAGGPKGRGAFYKLHQELSVHFRLAKSLSALSPFLTH